MCLFLLLAALPGLPVNATHAQAAPMSFSLLTASGVEGCGKHCSVVVVASGEIDNTAASRFDMLVRNHLRSGTAGLTVLLTSPGGFVVAAAKLGTLFRKYRATVAVASAAWTNPQTLKVRLAAGSCTSACVYAFMGGVRRIAPPGSRLVLHRSYADGSWFEGREYNNEVLQNYITGYTKEMGIHPQVVQFAESLPPDRLYTLRPEQFEAWNLARQRF